MEYLFELGVFSGKVAVIVVGILIVLTAIASLVIRAKGHKDHLDVEHLNEKYKNFARSLHSRILSKKKLKQLDKKNKKESKSKKSEKNCLYVIDFEGDIRASAVHRLRDEVTAVLSVAKEGDEVVVTLDSGGGLVHAYGLAAAQLLRFKENKVKLTVCVDKIAASGGYMMACTGDQILAAPFAIIGSIGVLAQVPNFNRLLRKNDIEYEEITAGEYKRTISLLGEITEKGREKFSEQIEETHTHFKAFVQEQRPNLDIQKVATGEHWLAKEAIDYKLVDQIITSDEYIFNQKDDKEIYRLSMQSKKKIMEALSEAVSTGVKKAALSVWEQVSNKNIFQ